MEQKALELIAGKLESALKGSHTLRWAETEEDGRYALLTGQNAAYGVFYDAEGKRFALKICPLAEGEPDGSWSNLSVWLFDPDSDSERDVESIANDFLETVSGPVRTIQKTKKRPKKDDENNVDPVFFINRMVTLFPELKEDLAEHKFYHPDVLPVYFVREKIAPKILETWNGPGGMASKLSDKVFELINECYKNGDLDTKGLITQVILNSVTEPELQARAEEKVGEDLRKIWVAGRKFRDNPAKPEKPKVPGGWMSRFTADTLLNKK